MARRGAIEGLFTSESVCAGHPDKICDQISDAIVDEALGQDTFARVAVETLVTKNRTALAGEVTLTGQIDYEAVARQQIKRLGYTNPAFAFTDHSPIDVYIHEQSREIAEGVDNEGAGDQGMMFGYATSETPSFMPAALAIAHRLAQSIDAARESGRLPYLRPDGKTQVTLAYEKGIPRRVEHVILAVPHDEHVALEEVRMDLFHEVVLPVLTEFSFLPIPFSRLIVNGTGVWHIGGPASDTGVTGRKIIVDTYGGYARAGGGAFSGKDPTKVDRSMAYLARYVAKNVVAHGLAERAENRLAFVIGGKKPLMNEIETFGTEKYPPAVINAFVQKLVRDSSVRGILELLHLRQSIYLPTAAYGHFGRSQFPWEQIANV